MSDLISREAICNECMIEKGGKGCWACLVNDAPTVDAVEVVRCKDCKHFAYDWTYCGSDVHYCKKHKCAKRESEFCSDGERKEVGE